MKEGDRMTSRRPARKATPPAADSFRLLFHDHPIPMWVYDRESLAFLEVNDATHGD
jgi:hypothetical protein